MGKHLSEALARTWRGKLPLVLLCLAVWTPTEVLAELLWSLIGDERFVMLTTTFVYLAGTSACTAGFMHVFARDTQGATTSPSEAMRMAMKRAVPVFLTQMLVQVLVLVGLLLLVIPALVAVVWCSLSTAIIVVEGSSGWPALRRSRELVRGRFWPIVGVTAVLWIVPMVVNLGLTVIVNLAPGQELMLNLATGWLTILLQAPVHAALFGFYLEARLGDR